MIKSFKRRSIRFLLPLMTLAGFAACNKDISLSLDNSVDEQIGVAPMDTMSVKLSTYQLDDIPTSGTGTVLVGKNTNAVTGTVKSTSFMRLGIGTVSSSKLPDDALLDSVSLVLIPNRYYYGDTTQVQKISVHRVLEDINQTLIDQTKPIDQRPVFVNSAAIFSDQSFEFDNSPLAELSFKPNVKSIDSLYFKFNNTISNELFSLIKNEDSRILNNSNFQEYFKGLTLIPDEENTTLIGFKDTVYLQVHYSYRNNDGIKSTGEQSFTIDNGNFQYNKIETDRSSTKFKTLSFTDPQINSELTNGSVFLEGSTGVVSKIEFPTLLSFINDPSIAINKAELVIEADKASSDKFDSPKSLILMVASPNGNPVSILNVPFSQQTQSQQAVLVPGDDFGSNGKYVFNMLEYLTNFKKEAYRNTSLYLSLPTSELFSTGNRLIVAKDSNNIPNIKLNILYTKFQ